MKTIIRQLILASVVAFGAFVPVAAIQQAPIQAKESRKAVCKTYGPEEWYLLTSTYSEYGGTYCAR